jgi:F-type H+-transporting ATPase subunit b
MESLNSIIKSLSFDWRYFLAQIVLFIVLTLVLNQVFWKPMLAHLKRRDESIKDAYKTVDSSRHEMEGLRADYQARIIKIESEARSHIQQAIKEAQTERERILAEARAHAEAAIREGVEAMEREKAEALTSLRQRMVGIAVAAVDKAMGRAADPELLRRSIEERIVARN